jgi:NifU-like protein involved in Fe-S cluster formation
MPELNDLYSDRILALAAGISRTTRLPAPQATASAHSKLCGSTVTIDLLLENGRVADYGQTVKACLLGQSTAAVMAAQIIGSSPDELRAVGARMRAMLKQNGPPPDGRWADLGALEPVREVKGRHASTLLVFDAVERALASIDAGATAVAG